MTMHRLVSRVLCLPLCSLNNLNTAMPGISICLFDCTMESEWKANINRALSSMLHAPHYRTKVHYEEPGVLIASTCYPQYPLRILNSPTAFVAFEGTCYSACGDQLDRQLSGLADCLDGSEKGYAAVEHWVKNTDGDFVCVVLRKAQQRLWVLNDRLGRLPTYMRECADCIVVSREIKCCAMLGDDFEFDRQGIAETLAFGYTLGTSTLIRGIKRLNAGVCLCINTLTRQATKHVTHVLNCDSLLSQTQVSTVQYAEQLAAHFLSACRALRRAHPDSHNLVSLSGGLDSRAVLAGMRKAEALVSAFSFQDASMATRGRDAAHAQMIAERLGSAWSLFQRPDLSQGEVDRLVWIKDGMNYTQMAFLLSLHRQLGFTHGYDSTHLSGDHGGLLQTRGPVVCLKNFEHFARCIVSRHVRVSLEKVAWITGVSEAEVREGVYRKLESYPEHDFNNRYLHFMSAERLGNLNFQAEDRNRTYFWHASPFASQSFWECAFAVPDKLKRYCRLYEVFLRIVEPRCLDIPYANWNAPLSSYKRYWVPLQKGVYGRLPSWLRVAVRGRVLYHRVSESAAIRAYAAQTPVGD